jgi:hypothetical protein
MDPLCMVMGIADIIAGLLIFLAFGANPLGIAFGSLMILKGGISFL